MNTMNTSIGGRVGATEDACGDARSQNNAVLHKHTGSKVRQLVTVG
jgi:hypothetical protein